MVARIDGTHRECIDVDDAAAARDSVPRSANAQDRPLSLQTALEQLQQATLDHAVWRDHLLRVISGRRPCDRSDLAPDAHRRCLFGQWYFRQAPPELRELPSFAMLGAEHEAQHRIAAGLLACVAAGAPAERPAIEDRGSQRATELRAVFRQARDRVCVAQ